MEDQKLRNLELINQDQIHNQYLSKDSKDRIKALENIRDSFPLLPYKQKAWNKIIKLTNDKEWDVKSKAVEVLDSVFLYVPDKKKAWNDLIGLVNNKDFEMKSRIFFTLGSTFPHMQNKKQAWDELIELNTYKGKNLTWNDRILLTKPDAYENVRVTGFSALCSALTHMSEIQQAWSDLVKLITIEERSSIKLKFISTLLSFLPEFPDKQLAFNDLINLTNDEDNYVREEAAKVIGSFFAQIPDKQSVWDNLYRIINYCDCHYSNISFLVLAFLDMPNKQKAWDDLQKTIIDESSSRRKPASSIISKIFLQVPNKKQAWDILIKMSTDDDSSLRYNAVSVLQSLFPQLPDQQKEVAWKILLDLNTDKSSSVRDNTVFVLRSLFFQLPDQQKEVAWKTLLKLNTDEDRSVKSSATSAIISIFSQLPYNQKEKVWNDLHELICNTSCVNRQFVEFFGSVFLDMPDQLQSWKELCNLTFPWIEENIVNEAFDSLLLGFSRMKNKQEALHELYWIAKEEDRAIRYDGVYTFLSAFSEIPDNQQAWEYLYDLITDDYVWNRYRVTITLGSFFSHAPDKQKALNCLIELANDNENYVRVHANHFLGKYAIIKASQAESEENYKIELEKAIEFFEKAVKESPNEIDNPSQFCFPFYRTFYTIVFKKQESKEVENFLAENQVSMKGSKSKILLFKAIKNLVNALKEVQDLNNLDFEAKKGELNNYREYCDRAEELMRETEERAPYATATMRKGMPILGRNLKAILEEIQEKAKNACKESQGTPTQEIACTINQEVQKWEIGNQEEMTQNIEDLIEIFRLRMPHLPGYEHIFNEIEGIRDEKDLVHQYKIISRLIGLIPLFNSVPDDVVQDIRDTKDNTLHIEVKLDAVGDKLSCISFNVFKLKLNSHNVISNLDVMKKELERLNEIESLNESLMDKLDTTQAGKLNGLNNDILARLDEIKIIIDDLPKNDDTEKIFDLLNELKQSDSDTLLQRSSAIVTLISFIIPVLQKILIHSPV